MFCPACSSKNSVEQKFCRSCGMNLERTAESMLEQFSDVSKTDLERQEKMLERVGSIAFTGFGIVVGIAFLAILYLILTRMVLSGTQPLPGVLLIAFLVFAGLSLGYVIWRESLSEKSLKLDKARNLAGLNAPDTAKLLAEKPLEHLPVPSVVEETTGLLVENKTTKL